MIGSLLSRFKRPLQLLLLTLLTLHVQSQIQPAPPDKAVIYFVRTSSLGMVINFTYFDSTSVIGKFNGPKYMRYECQPGKHLFWARSENKSFVEAEVDAGKIYILHAVVFFGAAKASVDLTPVDPSNYDLNKIERMITKKKSKEFSDSELREWDTEMAEVIERGMEQYRELRSSEEGVRKLTSDMKYR